MSASKETDLLPPLQSTIATMEPLSKEERARLLACLCIFYGVSEEVLGAMRRADYFIGRREP